MPRGYRCIVLAAVGWLIAGASTPTPQRQIEQAKAEQRQDRATKQTGPVATDQAAKPEEKDQGCPYGPEDRSSDLCAQWKAADAAAEAAIWSRETYYLSLVGTGAVIAALLLALWSNILARRAIDVDNRPWVHAESLSIAFGQPEDGSDDICYTLNLKLTNIGKTAAANVIVRCSLTNSPVSADRLLRSPGSSVPSAFPDNLIPNSPTGVRLAQAIAPADAVDEEGGGCLLATSIQYTAPSSKKVRRLDQIWHVSTKPNNVMVHVPDHEWFRDAYRRNPSLHIFQTVRMT